MNVILKIKRSQLDTLIEELQNIDKNIPNSIAEKCMYYLFNRCFKKLLKKQIDKADDFENNAFRMTLKYEEATALYMQLCKVPSTNNCYTSNVILTYKNYLSQKLQ